MATIMATGLFCFLNNRSLPNILTNGINGKLEIGTLYYFLMDKPNLPVNVQNGMNLPSMNGNICCKQASLTRLSGDTAQNILEKQ